MDPVDCSGSAAVHSSGSRRILVPGRSGREERGREFRPPSPGSAFCKSRCSGGCGGIGGRPGGGSGLAGNED